MISAQKADRLDGQPQAAAVSDALSPATEFVDVSDQFRGRELPNAMSVDVEDYFQVSAFEKHVSRDDWDSIPSRVPANIHRILELFDAHGVTATFFTLGWVCENHPTLIREIVAAGHELASHGHDHARVWSLGRQRFQQDIADTRKRLEDTAGTVVKGYRAPSFSIGTESMWAYDALREAGYVYSSSVFPIKHDHYGLPSAPRFVSRIMPADMLEIPMSSVSFFGRNWPCSGGGYFRLMPLAYSLWAAKRINRQDDMPVMFYFHPWEMDPDQPRIDGLPFKSRFRHYLNLNRFESRLTRLLQELPWSRIDKIYLDSE